VEILSQCLLNNFLQCSLEGYERLAIARGKVAAISEGLEDSGNGMEKGLSSGVTGLGAASSAPSDGDVGPSIPSVSTAEISGCDGDAFDMFGDDEDNATAIASQPSSDGLNAISGGKLLWLATMIVEILGWNSNSLVSCADEVVMHPVLGLMFLIACYAAGSLQNDYVYDETSGYSLPLFPGF